MSASFCGDTCPSQQLQHEVATRSLRCPYANRACVIILATHATFRGVAFLGRSAHVRKRGIYSGTVDSRIAEHCSEAHVTKLQAAAVTLVFAQTGLST